MRGHKRPKPELRTRRSGVRIPYRVPKGHPVRDGPFDTLRLGFESCRTARWAVREPARTLANTLDNESLIACVPRQRRTETRRPAAILQKHGGLRRSVLVVRQGMCYNNTYYRSVYLSLDPDDGTPARTTFLFVEISA